MVRHSATVVPRILACCLAGLFCPAPASEFLSKQRSLHRGAVGRRSRAAMAFLRSGWWGQRQDPDSCECQGGAACGQTFAAMPGPTTTMPAPAQPPIPGPPPPPPLPGPPPPLPPIPVAPPAGLPGLPGISLKSLPTLGPPPLWKMTPAPTQPPPVTTPPPPTTAGPSTSWQETPLGLIAGTTPNPWLQFTTTLPPPPPLPGPAPAPSAASNASAVEHRLTAGTAAEVYNEAETKAFEDDPRGMLNKTLEDHMRKTLEDPEDYAKVLSGALELALRFGMSNDDELIQFARSLLDRLIHFLGDAHAALYDAMNAEDGTLDSLSEAIELAHALGGLTDDDKYMVEAKDILAEWRAFQNDPKEMLVEEWSALDVSPHSLSHAINLAKRLGNMTDENKYILEAMGKLATLEAYQGPEKANEMLRKVLDDPDATVESLTEAVLLAKRIGGLKDGDKYIVAVDEKLAKMKLDKAGKPAKAGTLLQWGASFLYPTPCRCPCMDSATLDGVDRAFKSIVLGPDEPWR